MPCHGRQDLVCVSVERSEPRHLTVTKYFGCKYPKNKLK